MKKSSTSYFRIPLLSLPLLLSAPNAWASKANDTEITQQSSKATGVVTDANGEPIIGASVVVKDTKQGAVTDSEGNFTIDNVSHGATLIISYVGYKTRTVTWSGKSLNVSIDEDNHGLGEVVVVGYGTQKKINLTGSVSSVSGDDFQLRPITDATQALAGTVPGLFVSSADAGRPGASGSLTLRGQGNLSGTGQPYVLVDGVEMDLSDVNPEDIESISVLKDASSSAIYGARAAYGVILVTTKKGAEGKPNINYQGSVGWTSPTKLPEMVNSVDFAHYWNDGVTNTGSTRLYSDEKIALLQQYIDNPSSVNPWQEFPAGSLMNPAFENSELGIGNVDYFKLHYKDHAVKQNHNLSLSGGSKLAKYYVSSGYYKEDGLLRYADINYERLSLPEKSCH